MPFTIEKSSIRESERRRALLIVDDHLRHTFHRFKLEAKACHFNNEAHRVHASPFFVWNRRDGFACAFELGREARILSFPFEVAGVAELADALDSKSSDRKIVWVRAPPPAIPLEN
jgi:hypothetical protein